MWQSINPTCIRFIYLLTPAGGSKYQVHRPVLHTVFNIGHRVMTRCEQKKFIDGRAGAAGPNPFELMREKIKRFWLTEVDTQPSHYDSVSTVQLVVGVTSICHGWLIFFIEILQWKIPGVHVKTILSGSYSEPPVCVGCRGGTDHVMCDMYCRIKGFECEADKF